jgi:putative Ca2+/H+ antiporter (TMEM165/GDT1 family)
MSNAALPVDAPSSDFQVFCRSVAIVGIAEMFDKTWFMGLILALRYKPSIVFIGSFSALFLHTILAAAMGYAFARFLPPLVLSCLTVALFVVFTILYAKDWYEADPEGDAIEQGKRDAAEDGGLMSGSASEMTDDGMDHKLEEQVLKCTSGDESTAEEGQVFTTSDVSVLWKSFVGVFIAEWGDRTQIAMIGQHASQPLIPVFTGSCVAFFFLTLSAVLAASMLQNIKLREKTVNGVIACCFGVFAILALIDAVRLMHKK